MTPKTAVWDIYRIRIDSAEPRFKSWVCKMPATSEQHAMSRVREQLDAARVFTLSVIAS